MSSHICLISLSLSVACVPKLWPRLIVVWDNHRATTAALTCCRAVEVPQFLAFQITIVPLLGFWLSQNIILHELSTMIGGTYWIPHADLSWCALFTYYRDGAAFSTSAVEKEKNPPFPFTSGFHLRRDEADWRQLNHWESRESTSKISWFIHNFSPHECWYGDVSIWWDRNVEAGPGCLWCTAQRDPRVISSASECFCLLCSLVLFSEDGRCVIFSFCRQTWLSLTYITRDRNKGSRRSLGNAVWINTPRRCSFNWSLLEENVCFVWIKADLQYSCFVLEASR